MKYLVSLFAMLILASCGIQNNSQYSKIEYEAGACFGFCPIFKMTVNPDRTAIIDAEHFTFEEGRSKGDFSKEKEGIFKTTIKEADYNKMISMLDALNLKSLDTKYGNRNVTDLPTSYLNVTYKDGSMKKIEDYGKKGTQKLSQLWKFMEELRKTQTWTKVN